MAIERKLTEHPHHGEKGLGSDGRSRLRNWVNGIGGTGSSYGEDGRCAPSSREECSSQGFDKGESYRSTSQFEAAALTFKKLDKARSTVQTPIDKRSHLSKHE